MKQTEKITAGEVKEVLPEPLITYLWKLSRRRMTLFSQTQYFTLAPELLCGRPVQDVLHKAGEAEPAIHYRVFGIEPVCIRVKVHCSRERQEMMLA